MSERKTDDDVIREMFPTDVAADLAERRLAEARERHKAERWRRNSLAALRMWLR